MDQYNKFFDFVLSRDDQISLDKLVGSNLHSLFYSFGLNNAGNGICWVFIRCCQYTEHFTISLLNEMNSKFQDQLIKTTEIVKESINKLFHEQDLKINKIKSENQELKTLVHNLINEIHDLKENKKEKFHDINKELNILSSEFEKLKKENEKLRSSTNEIESLYYNLMDEIYELKEHASSLSDRLQDLETPVKQPPLILI
jgi:chromosome segregation ATPase